MFVSIFVWLHDNDSDAEKDYGIVSLTESEKQWWNQLQLFFQRYTHISSK